MRISDWSSDVCSSDLVCPAGHGTARIRYRVCPAICPAQLVPHPWPNAAFSPLLSCSVPLRPALASRVCLVGGSIRPPRGTAEQGDEEYQAVSSAIGGLLVAQSVSRDRKSTRLNSSH